MHIVFRVYYTRHKKGRPPKHKNKIVLIGWLANTLREPANQNACLRGTTGALKGTTGALKGATGALRGTTGAVRGATGALRGTTGALRGTTGALRGTVAFEAT